MTTEWEADAVETLQSLERYTLLKAIEESKKFVGKVMKEAVKIAGNKSVSKMHCQDAINNITAEEMQKKLK